MAVGEADAEPPGWAEAEPPGWAAAELHEAASDASAAKETRRTNVPGLDPLRRVIGEIMAQGRVDSSRRVVRRARRPFGTGAEE